MVFKAQKWVPQVEAPASSGQQLVGDFVMARNQSLFNWSEAKSVFIDAISGKSYRMGEIKENTEHLARSFSKALGWLPNEGSPSDKVIGIYALNTIDFLSATWAVHRLGGISLLIHPTSSPNEVEILMKKVNCKALITCTPLLPAAKNVFTRNDYDQANIFILNLPNEPSLVSTEESPYRSVLQLIREGSSLPELEKLSHNTVSNNDLVAYYCPTSGTSGSQKITQTTHANIIYNIMQATMFESYAKNRATETCLGILPLTHSYGLVLLHSTAWRGDTCVIHPRFDMQVVLQSIQKYSIERLYLIPPIIAALVNNPILFKLADLSCVKSIICGSSALGPRISEAFGEIQPGVKILQGYGLTEISVIASITSAHSIVPGSVGSLLPDVEARLVSADGSDVEAYGETGELHLRSPSVSKGYIGDEAATSMTFLADGWLKTGDVACFKLVDDVEHLFIVDRKKDILKVKGIQIAPTDIEAALLSHPAVDEAAVVGIDSEETGELPFAFIVRSKTAVADLDEAELRKTVNQHIEALLSEPHWLRKNVRFVEEIPKSHSGKALRFKLKELVAQA